MVAEAIRVLLVEDNPGDARLVRELLSGSRAIALHHADHLAAGLERLATHAVDVILLDLGLPDSQGLDTVRAVVAAAPQTPVVVLTGQDDESLGLAAVRAGAEDYVTKGLAEQALPRAVRYSAERAQTQARLRHVNQLLRAIRGINRLIVQGGEARHLIEGCCEELTRPGGFGSAFVWLVDDTGFVTMAAAAGLDSDAESARAINRSASPLRLKGLPWQGLMSPEAIADIWPAWPATGSAAAGLTLLARVECRGRLLGLLGVACGGNQEPVPDECALIGEVADDLGFALGAIEQGRLRERAEALAPARIRLLEFAADHSSLEVMQRTLDEVEALTGSLVGFFHVVEADQRTLSLQAWSTRTSREFCRAEGEGLHYDVDQAGVWADCVRERQPVVHNDYAALPHKKGLPDGHAPLVRELVVPVFRDQSIVAIVGVGNKPSFYTKEDVDVAAYLGDVAWEIASRKQVEAERADLQASLAQADRLASMGMLAAGVAHEINNPLTFVLYNLETLHRELPRVAGIISRSQDMLADPAAAELAGAMLRGVLQGVAETSERLGEALDGAMRIKNITRSLATFARVETDELAPVSVQASIEHAATMAFNEIKYRARLVKDFSPVPEVLASEGKLAQVFLNLLINAAHAITEGDIEGNQIRVRTFTEGDWVCVEVSDTGTGIPPEHQAHIFEPFFTTKGVGNGSGLGLSICRNLILGFGGDLSFTTAAGVGTRFLIRLPRVPQGWTPRVDAEPPPTAAREVIRGRILVVDDEREIRGMIARMLADGHEVVTASSGEEGRVILSRDRAFDIIFCDLMMPRLSGMDLHAWLAGEAADLAGRVVFITGGAFTPGASAYLAQAGNLCVEKPFDADALIRMTDQLVAAARSGSGGGQG